MGVELRDDEAAFRTMGDHDLIDSYLVYRARDTLCSVSSVSIFELASWLLVRLLIVWFGFQLEKFQHLAQGDTEDYRQLLSAMNPEELGANEVAMLVVCNMFVPIII